MGFLPIYQCTVCRGRKPVEEFKFIGKRPRKQPECARCWNIIHGRRKYRQIRWS